MRFLRAKVKARVGERLTVEFSEPTKVLIMTDREFKKYQNHNTYSFFGGEKESPYEFTVPKSTSWNVVVEKGSYFNPKDITAKITKSSGTELPKGTDEIPASKKKKKNKNKGGKEETIKNEEPIAESSADEVEESE